jgi:hypothetical protein
MLQERALRCLEPGLSVLIGTAGACGMPVSCRGIAIRTDDDLATITVYVPVATSHETIQNLATTRRLAVGVTHPRDNFSTQFKGTMLETRVARDEEAAFVRERLDAFADVLDHVGIPRRITRSLACWPAFAVTMRVEQTFDQTPGPRAGNVVP